MTAGIRAYNDYGDLQFSSEVGSECVTAGSQFSLAQLQYASVGLKDAFWAKLSPNSCVYISNPASTGTNPVLYQRQGSGVFRKANVLGAVLQSGYFDVYDESGKVTWSAKSMEYVPDIQGDLVFSKQNIIDGSGTQIVPDGYFVCLSFAVMTRLGSADVGVGIALWRASAGGYFLRAEGPSEALPTLYGAIPNQVRVPYARIR